MVEQDHTILEFFQTLSERVYVENRISDVLWAALHSSEVVFKVLGSLIGLDADENAGSTQVRREPTFLILDDSGKKKQVRPDFLFEPTNGQPILIEVKLYDTNYHYDKYEKIRIDKIKPNIVLLSAHKPISDELKGWDKLEWRELVERLEAADIDSPFVKGLTLYLRKVTGMIDINTVNFREDGPFAMLHLNRMFEKVIRDYPETNIDVRTEIETKAKGCTAEYSGYHYQLKHNDYEPTAYLYFGIVYKDNLKGIQLYSKSWLNDDVIENKLKDKYKNQTKKDKDGIWVILDEDEFKDAFMSGSVNKEDQFDCLKKYFKDFNDVVAAALKE